MTDEEIWSLGWKRLLGCFFLQENGVKPIAKLLLGGIEDGEYGEVDIETSHREIEAMQERLVTSGGDVWVSLYALDVDALRGELLDVLQFESHRMGAVSEGILRRAIARMDDVSPNAEITGAGTASAGLPGSAATDGGDDGDMG